MPPPGQLARRLLAAPRRRNSGLGGVRAVHSWKLLQQFGQLFMPHLLRELHLRGGRGAHRCFRKRGGASGSARPRQRAQAYNNEGRQNGGPRLAHVERADACDGILEAGQGCVSALANTSEVVSTSGAIAAGNSCGPAALMRSYPSVHNSGRLALRAREHDVNKILGGRDLGNERVQAPPRYSGRIAVPPGSNFRLAGIQKQQRMHSTCL